MLDVIDMVPTGGELSRARVDDGAEDEHLPAEVGGKKPEIFLASALRKASARRLWQAPERRFHL